MITLVGRAREALKELKFQDWTFYAGLDAGVPYLQVSFKAKCPTNGFMQEWQGRKWQLHQHMDKSDIVRTAFKAVMTAMEHEARENFLYRGRPIFGPHQDIDALWEASQ